MSENNSSTSFFDGKKLYLVLLTGLGGAVGAYLNGVVDWKVLACAFFAAALVAAKKSGENRAEGKLDQQNTMLEGIADALDLIVNKGKGGAGQASIPGPEVPSGPPSATPEPPSNVGRVLLPILLVTTMFLGACSLFEAHVFDAQTVNQIDKTIANREADFKRWGEEMAKADPAKRDAKGLEIRNESEIDRLNAWRRYELAKQPPTATAEVKP